MESQPRLTLWRGEGVEHWMEAASPCHGKTVAVKWGRGRVAGMYCVAGPTETCSLCQGEGRQGKSCSLVLGNCVTGDNLLSDLIEQKILGQGGHRNVTCSLAWAYQANL